MAASKHKRLRVVKALLAAGANKDLQSSARTVGVEAFLGRGRLVDCWRAEYRRDHSLRGLVRLYVNVAIHPNVHCFTVEVHGSLLGLPYLEIGVYL